MKLNSLRITLGGVVLTACLAAASSASAQVSLTGSAYSQNFDTLTTSTSSTAWANNSTLPGWYLYNKDLAAITTYLGGTGSSNSGSFYSFGASGDGERALGGVGSGGSYFGSPASGTVAGWSAVALTNNTGAAIDSFTVNYDGEQWRNGGNTSAQTMVLEYGFGASFASVGSWTAPGAGFNFTSPTIGSTAAALDGNAGANRAANLGGSVSSLNWSTSETLWVRWIENNDVGNDHGLAVDNFNFQYTTVQANPILGASGGDAGNVRIGTLGLLNASATNTGAGTLTGTFPLASGEFGGGGTGFSLGAGASQNEIYTYAPTDHGPDVQIVGVSSNGGASNIPLQGTGVGPEFADDDADDMIDVGNVFFGGPSSAAFTISNSTSDGDLGGLTDMTITDVTVIDNDGFVLFSTDLTAGTVIPAGGSQVVNVFGDYGGTPQQFSTGTLIIGTDVGAALGADGADFTFALKGYAVPEPGSLALAGLGALGLIGMVIRRRSA